MQNDFDPSTRAGVSSEQRVRDFLSGVPGVVWELRESPEHPDCGGAFVSDPHGLLGYSSEEWLSTPQFWRDVVHPQDRDRVAQELTAIYEKGDGAVQCRWLARNQRSIWVLTFASVTVGRRARPPAFVA